MRLRVAVLLAGVVLAHASARAEPVDVRYAEGVVHGLLVVRDLQDQTLGSGELLQVPRGDRLTSRMVLSFKDGSVHDESVVFTQKRRFRLLSYKLVQKGPSFAHPVEVAFEGGGPVTVKHTDDGEEKTETERLEMPPDLANGLVPILLKNVRPEALPKVSFVAATPKPRLVKLAVTSAGEDSFSVAGQAHKAHHYVVKVEIGGLAGVVAPVVGKQPPNTHVWIASGEAPGFVRSEGPLAMGGAIWRIDLAEAKW
jgi:hypothetical protein